MWRRSLLVPLAWLLCAAPAAAEETLTFRGDGATRALTKEELRAACGVRTVEVDDPYHETRRRYVACPLERVLELGFGAAPADLLPRELLFRARDGYTRTAAARLVLEGGAFLALEGADRAARGESGFDPIDRRQVDPAPFYVVWTGAGRSDTHRYPWPYQLVAVELVTFEAQFPHTVPEGAAEGSPARRGFELFRAECAHCHAMNGEGGRVGPELNVPRSIVEYRPEGQIKAYIRDPSSFRYTTMPSHTHLEERDLDDLVAYFRHMAQRKHDPNRPGRPGRPVPPSGAAPAPGADGR